MASEISKGKPDDGGRPGDGGGLRGGERDSAAVAKQAVGNNRMGGAGGGGEESLANSLIGIRERQDGPTWVDGERGGRRQRGLWSRRWDRGGRRVRREGEEYGGE